MVCGCRKNVQLPEVPSELQWGPALWLLLHSLAEKSGKSTTRSGQNDEKYAWRNLIANLHFVIPCTECKDHFIQYKASNPFPDPFVVPYEQLHQKIRTWFFNLHTHITNTYLQVNIAPILDEPIFDESLYIEETMEPIIEQPVENTEVTLDCLQELYGTTDLRKAYYNAKILISKFYNTPYVSIIKWHIFEAAVIRLLTVFGA